MRKLSKVLSVLLAMVLLFSTVSIGVEAAYNAYKDAAITRYDSIDKPVLTPDQYASMAMDEIDRMLAEENIKIEYDLAGLITIKADFSSVDKALKSVSDLYGQIQPLLGTLKGDIQNLDFSALLECPKRGDAGSTDADIFLKVLEFLSDNAGIVKKVGNGTLDLGPVLSNFVDVSEYLDVPKLAKTYLAGFVHPELPKDQLDLTKTVDEYVAEFIDLMVTGTYDKKQSSTLNRISELIQTYVPGINEQIDFLNDSVYTVIDKGLKIMINQVAVPFANPRLKAALRRLCGYEYKKTKDADGDTIWVPDYSEHTLAEQEANLNGLQNVVNVNFNLSTFPIASWGDDLLIKHLNDILGQIVRAAMNPSITYEWKTARGNDEILGNIITVAKKVLEYSGDEFFASYVEVLTPDQVNAMSDDQFIAYILRSIMNGSIDDVYIPNTVDTTMDVLCETVRSIAATVVPSQNYYNLPNSLETMIRMGLDMAAYGLNTITNMDLAYDLSEDAFANACMDWVIENYGGFVSEVDGNDGWEKLSYVLFQIIPSDWLPDRADGSARDNIYTLIFTDIVEPILEDFDLNAILGLLDVNEYGELNQPIIAVILARLTGIINYVIPGVIPEGMTQLEDLLDPDNLSSIIEGLLTGLYDRAQNGLMESLIPLACLILDLSTPEEFGYPYISLEDQHSADMVSLPSFYMYNGSKGINTNATNKYGQKTQDKLYTYYIRSVETNNDAITVSPAGVYINGGTSQTFTFNGDMSAAKDTVLKVTITYDVYGEKGTSAPITPQPLTATTYTYIYDKGEISDDSEKIKADANPNGNTHLIYYKPTTYLSADSKLSDLADYSMDIQRNVVQDSSTHTRDATVTLDNYALDPALSAAGVSVQPLSVATNRRGTSESYSPYAVADASATIPEGSYANNFWIKATRTESVDETISFTHNIFVYNDFNLSSMLNSAVRADRQQANYGTGTYEAEYPAYGTEYDDDGQPLDVTVESVNGADAWDRYVEAVDAAAAIIYCPRQVGQMQTFVDNGDFENAAYELYEATQQLEACSVSSGTAQIKSVLDSIVTPDVDYIDDEGEEVRYEYDDPRHTYLAREDYISYTYSNFKSERRTAESLINQEKEALKNGEDFQLEAVRAAYAAHRLAIYGERLIRVKAYKTHLDRAIQTYAPLFNAGKGTWSTDSWNEFTRAYNFAVSVNAEPVGSTISGTENLVNDNSLRQSKVNEAREHLINSAKKLVEGTGTVDYTQLQAKINETKATYNAGIGNYTQASWNTFASAYEAAVALVAENAEDTEANRTRVANALTALTNGFKGLEENQQDEGYWYLDEDSDMKAIVSEISEMSYIVGLYDFDPQVTDYIYVEGGYDFEVEYNAVDAESTGAHVTILNGDGDAVEEYDVVFYCDVNGDGNIYNNDINVILDGLAAVGRTDWEDFFETDENAYAFAADTNHDGTLMSNDVLLVMDISAGRVTYNQAWAAEGDDIVL
ncbi:MAG: FIVAR domain-containing protein [Clostridia bacterium]|nr:FIVAR domain-containing protein [Clostridia bacterium]